MKGKFNFTKFLYIFVFLSLLLSAIFVGYLLIVSPYELAEGEVGRVKGDYILMFLQCVLGLIVLWLPSIITRNLEVEIPNFMLVLFTIFLYCAIFLGEVRSYYYNVPNWDTMLHTFSGAMLGALGFSFVAILNNSKEVPMNLSPVFVALFAFFFAISLGVFWEIYEYTADGILGTNMQKFGTEDGALFLGHAALRDTMKDLIVDTVGAGVMSFIGYISLKYKKGWVQQWQVRIHRGKN